MNEKLEIKYSVKDKAIIRSTKHLADIDLKIWKLEKELKTLNKKRDDVVYHYGILLETSEESMEELNK